MNDIKLKFINPPTLHKIAGITQVIEVTKGRTIVISGQVPINAQGQLLVLVIGNYKLNKCFTILMKH